MAGVPQSDLAGMCTFLLNYEEDDRIGGQPE
ncbi:hypothetical protein LCGC14_2871190, partial [marine sediment metagenome]